VVGVKELIKGGPAKAKPLIRAVPLGVTTVISPENAAPTTAVMVVEFTVKEVAGTPPKLTDVAPLKL
jgi:hypothetical protein